MQSEKNITSGDAYTRTLASAVSAVLLVILSATSGAEVRRLAGPIRAEALALLSLCTAQPEEPAATLEVRYLVVRMARAPEPGPVAIAANAHRVIAATGALPLSLLDLPPPERA